MVPLASSSAASSAAPTLSASDKSPLVTLDDLIRSGKPITYKGKNFKDGHVVAGFVKDHRLLKTAMIGVNDTCLYTDPCHCCLPAHGSRMCKPEITDATGLISEVRKAKASGKTLDVVFTSLNLYNQTRDSLATVSPETKLIVACDHRSGINASELRKQNIPAIDGRDYERCAPLNAVIALTVFNEFVS